MDQEKVFLESEGDEWFKRNVGKMSNNSSEIYTLGAWLKPFQAEIGRILEVGSGCGNKLAQLCNELDSDGLGIDPSKLAVDYANRKFSSKCKFRIGTADSLPSNLKNLDLIHFGFCLYLVSRNRLLKCVRQADLLLKPGGFISIFDFDPSESCSNEYRHYKGLISYKEDYYKLFCSLGNYSLVNKLSFSEESFHFALNPESRVSLTLLFKEK